MFDFLENSNTPSVDDALVQIYKKPASINMDRRCCTICRQMYALFQISAQVYALQGETIHNLMCKLNWSNRTLQTYSKTRARALAQASPLMVHPPNQALMKVAA